MSIILQGSAVEGCPLSGVPLYVYVCHNYDIKHDTCLLISFSISYCSCKCCCSSLHYIMCHHSTRTGFDHHTLQKRLVYLCGYLSNVNCGINTLILLQGRKCKLLGRYFENKGWKADENINLMYMLVVLRERYTPQIRIPLSLI